MNYLNGGLVFPLKCLDLNIFGHQQLGKREPLEEHEREQEHDEQEVRMRIPGKLEDQQKDS
jgi:hypothetical protein